MVMRFLVYWNEPRARFGLVSPRVYVRTMLEPHTLAAPGFGVNTFLVRDQLALLLEAQGRR